MYPKVLWKIQCSLKKTNTRYLEQLKPFVNTAIKIYLIKMFMSELH